MEDASLGQRAQPWTVGQEKGWSCISGVDARTYAKLEAEARIMGTNGEKKSCGERWQCGNDGPKKREKNRPAGVSK